MTRIERLERKLVAARRECQQLRLSLEQPHELARLRNGGRKTRFVLWLLKICSAINDFFVSILRRDSGDWGPMFVPYRIQVQEAERPAPYQVFHFIGNFAIGGSTQLVVHLIERLGHEYSHTVFCPKRPNPLPYQGARVQSVNTAKALAQLDRLIREVKPDISHVHFWGHPWYLKIFEILEANDCAVIENVNRPIAPFVSPTVLRYVYVSEFSRREFGLETQNDLVIYPGSDLAHFAQSGTSPSPPCLGMVYCLDSDKVDEGSILPFIRAIQRHPTLRALIVGDGDLLSSFRSRVDQSNSTRRSSFVDMSRTPTSHGISQGCLCFLRRFTPNPLARSPHLRWLKVFR